MKYIITDQIKLSHRPEGPLAKYLPSFADFLVSQGYSYWSILEKVRFSANFSHWLKQTRTNLHGLKADHVRNYLRYRKRQKKSCSGVACAIENILDFLRRKAVLSSQQNVEAPPSPVESYLARYAHYLREDRALAEITISSYIPIIRSFLGEKFGKKAFNLSRLGPCDVVTFVQHQASFLHKCRSKRMTTALRSFLNYARYSGDVTRDLAAAVPSVAYWAMSSIPRAISKDQVNQLLNSIERNTPLGLRDYAILLLLARLGLRAGEIVSLELGGINWSAGILTVRTKGGRLSNYPLPDEVGKAIAAYLQNGRPSSPCRNVFLRLNAPITGFRSSSGISCIVRRRLERINIKTPTKGAHQFRHGFATDMLRQGASLGEIGDLLGHMHPQTTRIYAKTDLETLHKLAMPWLGGVL